MKKKRLFYVIALFLCTIILISSYAQWKKKLSTFDNMEKIVVSSAKNDTEKAKKTELQNSNVVTDIAKINDLLAKTINQDPVIQELFKKRLDSEKKLNLLIVGSTYMNSGSPGYGEQLSAALKETYGDYIQVDVKAIEGSTSTFIDELNTTFSAKSSYDVVLLEPFTLNNNGVVTPEDQHNHILLIQKKIQSIVPDAALVLHPAHPLPNSVFYPKEVQVLQDFAKSKKIPYINHWEKWKDDNSVIKSGLIDDNSEPTNEGAKLWANVLINYFIAK